MTVDLNPDRLHSQGLLRRTTTSYPDGRIRVVENFGQEKVGVFKKIVRPRPKSESLRDNNRLNFPVGTLRSLRALLPDAFSLVGEDEDIFREGLQEKAETPPTEAVLAIIGANPKKIISSRQIAEKLVHSNPTFQSARNFPGIEDLEDTWVSDVDTALSDIWPSEERISDYLHGSS